MFAAFGDPYNVVFQIVNGMARFPVILHPASILKSSPKGEGFPPFPEWAIISSDRSAKSSLQRNKPNYE
jgi:hypothetical protein